MDYRAAIQESLDYMEANLRTDLTAGELAQRAGFSLYHYYRLFHSAVGMPVMRYLTRRRLLHGAWAMARGQSGIQTALDYGFDTYPGFYRAFRREFGCTIAELLEAGREKCPAGEHHAGGAHHDYEKESRRDVWPRWPEICREILAGYDEVAQLTDAERAAVPYIILANQQVCTAWFAGQDKYAELLRTNVDMTRFIVENLDAIRLLR